MKKLISYIIKIFNKISLYTLFFLIFVLYVVLFEIPIPFLANKVTKTIYEKNIDLSINSISLGWNYNINRPVVIIKGLLYNQGKYSVRLSKLGFYPSIPKLIKEKELYLEKIFVEGLNLIITSGEQEGYNIKLNNNDIITDTYKPLETEVPTKNQESFLEKIQKKDNFKKSLFYQLSLEIKKEIPTLQYLNEFIIYNSNITYVNQQKESLILEVEDLSLIEKPENIVINLKSLLILNDSENKPSKLTLNASINNKNIVEWSLSLEKVLLSNLHNHVTKDYFKNLTLEGFEGNIDMQGFYDTKLGLQNFNSSVYVKQGSLLYEDYISIPMKINSLSYDLFYDKKEDTINMKNFNINFANNNVLSSNIIGLNLVLDRLNADLKFDFKDNSLIANKITIFSGVNKLNTSIEYLPYSNKKQGYLKIESESSNLDIGFLKKNWPKKYLIEVRKWIVANISNAKIDKTSFKMNLTFSKDEASVSALEGEVFLSDAQLIYLQGLPKAQAKKVNVKYNMNDVVINYTDANTGDILSQTGEIRFFNNSKSKNTYEGAMSLNLEASSNLDEALLFINNKPLDLLKKTGLNANNLSGKVKGNIKLDYSFYSNEVFNKDIKLSLYNVSFVDVLPKIDVSGSNLNFLLNDNGLKINGTGFLFEEKIETGIQINWENKSNVIQTYSVDVKNFPIVKLQEFDFLDKTILAMVDGSIDGKFVYNKNNDEERLSFYTDLTNSLFYIDIFNYKNKQENKLILEGVSIFNNNKIQRIKDLKLYASDINVSMDIELNQEDNKSLIFNNFFIKDKANFKGTIDYSKEMKVFNLQGSFLDLYPILSYFKGNNNMYSDDNQKDISKGKEKNNKKRGIILRKNQKAEKEKQQEEIIKEEDISNIISEENFENINTDDTSLSDKIGNFKLKINFDKIINRNRSINDASLNILWKDNFLVLLSFSTKIGSSKESSYALFDEKTSILGFRIQNTGDFLRLLNFSSQISGGDLEGTIDIKKIISPDSKKFHIESNGKFVLNTFSAGINFATAYGSFRGKDLYFRVDELELQGNLMGGNMKGYVDVKNQYIDIYGKLMPIWGANNLFTNAPILKSLFDNVPVAKNLIQVNSRINGYFDDIHYSVFSKNLQKNDIINEFNYNKLGEK